MPLFLTSPITSIPLIGPTYAAKLRRLQIHTVEDLLHHYPSRYIDRSHITTIDTLQDGKQATIIAQVLDFKNIYTKTGKNLQQAVVADSTSKIKITWFNQRYLEQTIRVGDTYAFSGKAKNFYGTLSLTAPEFEKLDQTTPALKDGPYKQGNIHTGRLVPIYPETAGVSSKWLRSRINHTLKLLDDLPEHLPQDTIDLYRLSPLTQALTQIHFPTSKDTLKTAKHRLAFDELFFLQLQGSLKRHRLQHQTTPHQLTIENSKIENFISSLPFTLTSAQQTATKEILSDLQQSRPMNRLLEGDVGSGKTVVAAIAAYASHLSGCQSVLMAPTEILANQHHSELKKLFQNTHLTVGLQTGATKLQGNFDLTVGTHALLFGSKQKVIDSRPKPNSELRTTNYNQLALVITDEQHRFGVSQRAALEKLGNNPHRLTMSATPIPRTVALTLYGDLDVSIIDQMPVNRKPVKTWIVPGKKRSSCYQWINNQIENGDQVFIVCPLIDPSESLRLSEVKSATQEYEKIKTAFPSRSVDLLHGRLKSKNKDLIISKFKKGNTDILVTTPVIEVGIDISNATIILIEAAERFGLAQLHQLRGRVGRGDKQSYCLLFSSTDTKTDNRRLAALTKHHSGFKLAEIDLKLRGPGEVFGLQQHGFNTLKLARLTDKKLLQATKQAATDLVNTDPELSAHPLIQAKLQHLQSTETTDN